MRDEDFMQRALLLAHHAQTQAEVPVGAVVVLNNEIIGEGWNQPIQSHDPTAHAEIVAMRQAAKQLGNYRLSGASLYVTLEPCLMCLGAMTHARITRLVFGAYDSKIGATRECKHGIDCRAEVLENDCSKLLKSFFKEKR